MPDLERLAEALRLVRRDDEESQVPPRLEMAVMRAWDTRTSSRADRPSGYSRVWAGAFAGAACAVLVAAFWFRPAAHNITGPATQPQSYSLEAIAATEVLLEDDPASLQVVRLTVQPSMLSAFGYEFADPVNTDPINVELLIGLDGVPRAIRRVETSSELEY